MNIYYICISSFILFDVMLLTKYIIVVQLYIIYYYIIYELNISYTLYPLII